MPKKKTSKNPAPKISGIIEGAGEVVEQKIVTTIKENYMPYAMSVILSRAIPEIDGFKPSHRKLLFTMYKMGLLTGAKTKSANIVGSTMKLNPHGDSAIYDTMVRLSRGYEALLHPYVDSKGNFGKYYSRDMAWAASRYTEAKLDEICNELFRDIDKDTVNFVDNYDNTLKEPTLLPATFPSVLVNANTGIAVGMASNICSFNLREVCLTTISLIQDESHDILSTLPAPDFSGGGQIIFNPEIMREICNTGKGSIRVRSKYNYDKECSCIDITEIPPSTTSEAIIEKIVDLVKTAKIKEISDVRDETGLEGLKITIDLKRAADPHKLMAKLFKYTTLEDTFGCNFNVLIRSVPKILGIRELLLEWLTFRIECVRRRVSFDLQKKQDKLHLLKGLALILLDIDKAIQIIRHTENENDVVPNLMNGFNIDEIQAEYVAEIKLRHLNHAHILKRTEETAQLEKEISELGQILNSDSKIKSIIIKELKNVAEKFGRPRKSLIIYQDDMPKAEDTNEIPDYSVNLFCTKEGYFKKITPLSLRMGGDQKLKENDTVSDSIETANNADLLFFTNKCQVYKTKVSEFPDMKASVLGEYIPARLGMEEDENVIKMIATKEYQGMLLLVFENGKLAKIPIDVYYTKTNRKKLSKAFSDSSPLTDILLLFQDQDVLLTSSTGRRLLINTESISLKSSRTTLGISVLKLKKGQTVTRAVIYPELLFKKPERYRAKTIPALGAFLSDEDSGTEQLKFF